MKEQGFWFYASFRDAAAHLQDADRLALYDALLAYAIDGDEPECGGVVGAMMALMIPNINASRARAERSRANGMRGGRRNNPEATQTEPKRNPDESQSEPAENPDETIIKENENDKENDKEKEKPPRRMYGAYKHVRLTDAELARLDMEYGHDVIKEAIRVVDEYCQTSGKTYKDYNLVIRNWGIERARRGGKPAPKTNAFTAIASNAYDYSALERDLVENL